MMLLLLLLSLSPELADDDDDDEDDPIEMPELIEQAPGDASAPTLDVLLGAAMASAVLSALSDSSDLSATSSAACELQLGSSEGNPAG